MKLLKGCMCLSLLLLLGQFASGASTTATPGTPTVPASSEAPEANGGKESSPSSSQSPNPSSISSTTQLSTTAATGMAHTSAATTLADSSASGSTDTGQTTTKPAASSSSPSHTATTIPEDTTTLNTTSPETTSSNSSSSNSSLPTTMSASSTPASTSTAAATTPEHSTSASPSSDSSDTPTTTSTPSPSPTPTSSPTSSPTPSPTPTSTVPIPVAANVVLSETNLLLASEKLFVEMKGTPNDSLANLTLMVFDGSSDTVVWKVDFNNSQTLSASGFFVEAISADAVRSVTTVVISLYHSLGCNNSSSRCPSRNLVDFMALSTNSSHGVGPYVQETFLPKNQSVTVVESGLKLTLSRCVWGNATSTKDPSVFVLTEVSRDTENPCEVKKANDTEWTLQLLKQEGSACLQVRASGISSGGALEEKVENLLVGEINRRCRCGLTTLLLQVNGDLSCTAQNVLLHFKVKESYTGQTEKVIESFTALVREKTVFKVNGEVYSAVNCTRDCQPSPNHHPPGKPSKANSTVTVAVVLSSVAVFLIILIAVILYMRSKKRGIIRQFRMTRLEEDDDMDDMDDFIGGGGEASFSTRQR